MVHKYSLCKFWKCVIVKMYEILPSLIVDTCNLWVTCVEQLLSQKEKFFCGFWDEIPFDVPFDVIASTGSPVCMMCSQKDKYQDLGPSLENCINWLGLNLWWVLFESLKTISRFQGFLTGLESFRRVKKSLGKQYGV